MLYLDHLTIVAPSLVEGVEHVRECLDLDVPYGGTHPEMGTHNHVLRFDETTYLEVVAVDPDAAPPSRPRWFGLDDVRAVSVNWANGKRLRGWVARTDDIDAVLERKGDLLGSKLRLSKGGKFADISVPFDGNLPGDGVLPSVIDRAGQQPPSARMPDLGLRLRDFVLEHPTPEEISALYGDLGVLTGPRIHYGGAPRYVATIETPHGTRTLF